MVECPTACPVLNRVRTVTEAALALGIYSTLPDGEPRDVDISGFQDRALLDRFETMIASNPIFGSFWQYEVMRAVEYFQGGGDKDDNPAIITKEEWTEAYEGRPARLTEVMVNVQVAVAILGSLEKGEAIPGHPLKSNDYSTARTAAHLFLMMGIDDGMLPPADPREGVDILVFNNSEAVALAEKATASNPHLQSFWETEIRDRVKDFREDDEDGKPGLVSFDELDRWYWSDEEVAEITFNLRCAVAVVSALKTMGEEEPPSATPRPPPPANQPTQAMPESPPAKAPAPELDPQAPPPPPAPNPNTP